MPGDIAIKHPLNPSAKTTLEALPGDDQRLIMIMTLPHQVMSNLRLKKLCVCEQIVLDKLCVSKSCVCVCV